jgi:uncharacterized protein (TIGR02271 family)
MITKKSIQNVLGSTAYDSAHDTIGRIGHVYVDRQTGQPEWMTVQTGMVGGGRESFVPLEPAEVRNNEVVVPFDKKRIGNAPNIQADAAGNLSEQDEVQLYSYYGMQHPTIPAQTVKDGAMTRSEERLRVGTQTHETGRVHLRKYVVTEDQQQTVPVHKEKVRLEREPITDQNRGQAMPDISEADYEVVQREEQPVVAKETVPKERVRLAKDETTEQQTVGGQVRKERVDVQGLDEGQRR